MCHLKSITSIILTASISCLLIAGCSSKQSTSISAESSPESASIAASTETSPPETTLHSQNALQPEAQFPLDMLYYSGSGGWQAGITINANGTFDGFYTDHNMGDPPVTYVCNYIGKFIDIQKKDETSYSMTLGQLIPNEPEGIMHDERDENGLLLYSASPVGIDNGKHFILYTPDALASVVSTDVLSLQWPNRSQYTDLNNIPADTHLGCWVLYNVEGDTYFFSHLGPN